MKKALCVLLCCCLLCVSAPCALAADATFTLMIYLCGTDLESHGGAASADLREMVRSGVKKDGNVTVYIQTGGTKEWQTPGLENGQVERWTLSAEGMRLEDSVGRADMGDAQTFSDFLRYGFDHFPADRYGLIMWDHGSGASGGLCYDEMSRNALFYPDIYAGLQSASALKTFRPFSFIGFDACLMASYELAVHIAPFAEYMIASEELEPGTGWAYDGWLPALAADPSISIEALGQKIVDSFLSATLAQDSSDYATLSVSDLTKLAPLQSAVEAMGNSLSSEIDGGNFPTISRIRQNVRSFGEIFDSASDMIDLTVFADAFGRFDQRSAQAVRDALAEVVVYSRHTNNLTNVSGLSILVPFSTRGAAQEYMPFYETLDLSPGYAGFVSAMLCGISSGGDANSIGPAAIGQQSVQSAQIDWFSQYADDETSYNETAGSLWNHLYGSGYEEENSNDFSLDSFLSMLFGEDGDCSFNDGYDDASSSLWGGLEGGADLSFASNSGYSSGTAGNLWSSLDGENEAEGFWSGLPKPESQQVTVQTQDGDVSLVNPFAGMESEYAYTVSLTENQLDILGKVEANLMMDVSDPGFECYVELGYVQDVVVDWSRGKIYGMFNGTWASLDGQMVCLYDQIANERYIRSLIPVTVNGVECYLLVVFDEQSPGGRVIGWTEGYTEAGLPARGYTELQQDDVIVPQYELIYWDEDGQQQSEPFQGDPIAVGADGDISFGYAAVEAEAEYSYGFCLTDIYGDSTFSEFLPLSF